MTYVLIKNSSLIKEKVIVTKIFCLGSNYTEHIKEMGQQVHKDPVIFMKPPSAIIHDNESIVIPDFSLEAQHEVEIVFMISKEGKNISESNALSYIDSIGIGIDVTLRDVQKKAKTDGKPWVIAKGFDTSAPVSDFIPISRFDNLNSLDFSLFINNELKQKGNSVDMLLGIEKIIAYLSKIFTLQRGDLIFTGTPSGVGKINIGDKIRVVLDKYVELNVLVS